MTEDTQYSLKQTTLIISDMILQKLKGFNDRSKYGVLERELLEPYIAHLQFLQNVYLVQMYGDLQLSRYEKATLVQIHDELNKDQPDIDKIKAIIKPVHEFFSKILDPEAVADFRTYTAESMKHDLDILELDVKDLMENMPSAYTAEDIAKMKEQSSFSNKADEIEEMISALRKGFKKS